MMRVGCAQVVQRVVARASPVCVSAHHVTRQVASSRGVKLACGFGTLGSVRPGSLRSRDGLYSSGLGYAGEAVGGLPLIGWLVVWVSSLWGCEVLPPAGGKRVDA